MLLVPLSKMNTRDFLSVEVDLPFTVIPEDVSCQNPPLGSFSVAYVMLPSEYCASAKPIWHAQEFATHR